MTHTKGPWKLLRTPFNHDNFRDSVGTDKRIIAWTLRHYPGVPRTENSAEIDQANARLIAAAPELLEALKLAGELVSVARQHFPKSMHNSDKFQLEGTCVAIGAAIAKATTGGDRQ